MASELPEADALKVELLVRLGRVYPSVRLDEIFIERGYFETRTNGDMVSRHAIYLCTFRGCSAQRFIPGPVSELEHRLESLFRRLVIVYQGDFA